MTIATITNSGANAPSATLAGLNRDQQIAADKFLEFLFSPDKEFILAGPAGVGKTFLMRYLSREILKRYKEMCQILGENPIYENMVFTATTNKAAEVLSDAIGKEVPTVHSFFNLTVYEDYETGSTRIKRTARWAIHTNTIIVIDECSMINAELWKMLHEGTQNCKLVYVGDRHQLTPVLEKLSPIYQHQVMMVELKQQMRNSGQQALMDVCEQLRETVDTGIFSPIKVVPGVIDLLDDTTMQQELTRHFWSQTRNARILAYTNKRVTQYNDFIRTMRGLPDFFQKDELLICAQASTPTNSNRRAIPVETEVTVLENATPSPFEVDAEHGISLMVQRVTVKTNLQSTYTDLLAIYDRPHYQALLKYYSKNKDWVSYFNLKNQIVDLRPRDASTVYKAQGSTYDTVFIDLGNISTCTISDQVARMLYVAFSRARNRVFLYGNLAEKFGGLITA